MRIGSNKEVLASIMCCDDVPEEYKLHANRARLAFADIDCTTAVVIVIAMTCGL